MRLAMTWADATRRFTVRLAPGSRMRPPATRAMDVRIAGQKTSRRLVFEGKPLEVTL
jgi:hypothetical protein